MASESKTLTGPIPDLKACVEASDPVELGSSIFPHRFNLKTLGSALDGVFGRRDAASWPLFFLVRAHIHHGSRRSGPRLLRVVGESFSLHETHHECWVDPQYLFPFGQDFGDNGSILGTPNQDLRVPEGDGSLFIGGHRPQNRNGLLGRALVAYGREASVSSWSFPGLLRKGWWSASSLRYSGPRHRRAP